MAASVDVVGVFSENSLGVVHGLCKLRKIGEYLVTYVNFELS